MRSDLVIYGVALLLSLVGHVTLFEGLGDAARRAPAEEHVLEFAVIEPPPPPAEPPPPPPPAKKIEIKERPVKLETPPPPSATEPTPPENAEPPRPVFGISMSSTVGPGNGSGFSVRVGNTLMKDPDKNVTPPSDVKAYKAVPLYQVNKMPIKRGDCRADYPPAIKKLGITGAVVLEVDILTDGTVDNIRVTTSLGHGLDEVAVAALKLCRFIPAEVAGKAVATRIPYKFTFLIED